MTSTPLAAVVRPRPQHQDVAEPIAAGKPLDGDGQAGEIVDHRVHGVVDGGDIVGGALDRHPAAHARHHPREPRLWFLARHSRSFQRHAQPDSDAVQRR